MTHADTPTLERVASPTNATATGIGITIVAADGSRHTLTGKSGQSVMQLVTGNGLPGIIGECGGAAMCATCHVYVDPSWQDRLPSPLSIELEMLECTASEQRPESRLSCQLKLSAELDGLLLYLPDSQ